MIISGAQRMRTTTQFRRFIAATCLLILSGAVFARPVSLPEKATPAQLQSIRKYIKESWRTLTRSNARLADAAVDPKFQASPGGRWPVYLSRKENMKQVEQGLRSQMPQESFAKIELRQLPDDPREIASRGFFICPILTLCPAAGSTRCTVGIVTSSGRPPARRRDRTRENMADNFLYQIENYGKVLNANRTITDALSAAVPPPRWCLEFIGRHRRQWLRDAVPAIEKYYRFWTSEPHLTRRPVSRYYDFGDGPAPEVISTNAMKRANSLRPRKEYYRTSEVKTTTWPSITTVRKMNSPISFTKAIARCANQASIHRIDSGLST
jgi:alpha,alpha-trehalase